MIDIVVAETIIYLQNETASVTLNRFVYRPKTLHKLKECDR